MEKKLLWAVVGVLAVAVSVLFYFHFNAGGGQKIAYVNTGKLMDGYIRMKEAKEAAKSEAGKMQAQLDTLTQEFEQSLMKHEKALAGMSKKEKELSEQLLRTKQQQLMGYQNTIGRMISQKEAELTQPVLQEVNAKILEYGKKNGYRMILATANGNIAYGDDASDITEEILSVLQ